MTNIYGTIGYTLFKNPNTNNKIIILADMHDRLPECINQTNISDWFESKFHSSKILLEEVPRESVTLHELWPESPHTQKLKNLFLKNQNIIHAVDIRPYLVPFSWEILSELKTSTEEVYDIVLKKYLEKINKFFSMKDQYFIEKLPNYNLEKMKHTKLGKHFLILKKKCKNFLKNYSKSLNLKIKLIYQNNINLLNDLSIILDEIMEWYICANIELYSYKSIILHTGLAHSDNVIKLLKNHYNYKIEDSVGINSMDEVISIPMSGCVELPINIENQFGGIISDYNIGFYN